MFTGERSVVWRNLVLGVMVLMLAAPAWAQDERITLEVAERRDPNRNVVQDYGDVKWTEYILEEFNKLYPHIDVVFRTANADQIAVEIASGIGPDIVNGYGHKFINLGRQGGLLDLNPLMHKHKVDVYLDQTYWPNQLEAYEYQGKLFAFPQYLGTIGMFYNADMFAEAGLPEPEARLSGNNMGWDDLEGLAKKLTIDRTGDGQPDVYGFAMWLTGTDRLHYWMKAAGSDFYLDGDKNLSAYDNPQAIQALEFLQKMRWESQVMPPPGAPDKWLDGDVAINESGSYNLVNYLGRSSDGSRKVSFDWNVFPMPVGPTGERATLATNDGYGINRNTQHPDEAFALLQFLAGPVANEIRAKYLALQPAHGDVVPEYIDLINEMNRDIGDVNAFVFTEAGPYAYPEVIYAEPMAAEAVLKETYIKIFDQNQPVGPTWSDAIARLNTMMAESQKRQLQSADESVTWLGEQWTVSDLNTVISGVQTIHNDGTLVLSGAGWDIWGHQDGLRYMFQEVIGDFTATVKLHAAPNTHAWARAGIMIRTENTAAAPNVAILGSNEHGIVVTTRPILGETSRPGQTPWTNGEPVYLRLVRRGTAVTGQLSTDGIRWKDLTQVRIDFPEKVLIGLATSSHADASLGDGVFSEWQLSQ